MSSETKSDHDSLHLGEAIETMRQALLLGNDAGADVVLRKTLYPHCISWVRSGRRIPRIDAEDIVAQAVGRALEDLLSPSVPPAEASRRLKTALNTARAEHVRRARVEQNFASFEQYEAAFKLYREVDSASRTSREEESIRCEQHLLEVLEKLQGFLEISLEQLRSRDYAILHDFYALGEIGMADPAEPSPLPGLKDGARRVAVCRARRNFLDRLERLFREAYESPEGEARILEDMIKLVEGGHLAEVFDVRRRHLS